MPSKKSPLASATHANHVGSSSDTYFEILSGLEEGDTVAVSGGYLIDSESALLQPVENVAKTASKNSVAGSPKSATAAA